MHGPFHVAVENAEDSVPNADRDGPAHAGARDPVVWVGDHTDAVFENPRTTHMGPSSGGGSGMVTVRASTIWDRHLDGAVRVFAKYPLTSGDVHEPAS